MNNMRRKFVMKFLLLIGMIFAALSAQAQNAFWSFDDEQQPLTIAPECDARFEEVRGGVFVPSAEDTYQYGMAFLESASDEIRRQAPYCLLSAALQGHSAAQFQLAKMYNKGELLPQDDLSSYKWASIAAASGNKDAELFVLNLEQVLTTEDLALVGIDIKNHLDKMRDEMRKKLEAMVQETEALKAKSEKPADGAAVPLAPMPTGLSDIFTEEDRF